MTCRFKPVFPDLNTNIDVDSVAPFGCLHVKRKSVCWSIYWFWCDKLLTSPISWHVILNDIFYFILLYYIYMSAIVSRYFTD